MDNKNTGMGQNAGNEHDGMADIQKTPAKEVNNSNPEITKKMDESLFAKKTNEIRGNRES